MVAEVVSVKDQLVAKYSNLIQGGGCVIAAKNMRIELKLAFPGIKFSVKSSKYSGGNSIRVSYEDGPLREEVESIVNKYAYGNFDGMDDSYKYSDNAFADLFGGSYYVFVERSYSKDSVEQAIDLVANMYGDKDKPSYEEYKNGNAYNKYPGAEESYYYNWQQLVGIQLGQLDFFAKNVEMSA